MLVCAASALRAQESDASLNLRLAQSLEQAGDWERAIALYEGLYRSDPDNYVYFDGLRRGYTQLREYDKAIRLVERRLIAQPSDILLRASLGGLYYESGSAQKADSVWNHLIEVDSKNAGLYRVVASQMMEHRLFDQAIQVYREGRTATHNENAFTDELATLYSALQQYTDASTEFVKLLENSPQQLPFIESRIASFTVRKEGLQAATGVVRGEVEKKPENITLRKLLAWLAVEGGDYQAALEEYLAIDQLSKSNGAELLDFAKRASQERQFGIAAAAFRDIIERSQNPGVVSLARFGYARSMEDINGQADSAFATSPSDIPTGGEFLPARVSETEKSFQGIVRLYEEMIRDYPASDLAAESLYRIGMIRMNRFFDLNGALDAFRQVKQSARTVELKCSASQKIAEVFVLQNNLVSAREEYLSLQRTPLSTYQQ
ncbi:MAG TPA: tetratricopeptide repeat protein, partial [Bacteroidota bacterium]